MTSPDPSIISVRGASKTFGRVRAVDDVSFDIRRGEFFSLLGPSGCGKTTLLRLLAGFETPSSGTILIDGQDMSHVPANRRPTNMVFQNYAIFPHLSVRENIAYGLKAKRLGRSEIDAEVDRALETIKLAAGYGERRANQLSGGQRQRVALARALVCRPKVLLLDEPLGALDRKLREQMQFELRQLQETVGITFVLVTHDQGEALSLSDRIAVVDGGRILQLDAPARIYARPSSRAVAEFIGAMNFLPARVAEIASDIVVEAGGRGRFRAPAPDFPLAPGGQVILGVRPEHLVVSANPPAPAWNGLQGTFASQMFLGDRRHSHIAVEGLPAPLVAASPEAAGSPASAMRRGDQVWVGWPIEASVLLPVS